MKMLKKLWSHKWNIMNYILMFLYAIMVIKRAATDKEYCYRELKMPLCFDDDYEWPHL